MNNAAGICFIFAGLLLDISAAIALVRAMNIYARLNISVKLATLGTLLVLAGVIIIRGVSVSSSKALLCGLFLLISMTAITQAIGHSIYLTEERRKAAALKTDKR